MLKRAYDIIVLFKEYFLLALYLLTALVLFTQNTNDQVRGVRSHLLAAAGLLQDTFDFIPDYFALRRENSVLREQNILLSDQVNTLRESAIENIRLRSMFGLRERPAFNYVSALVVGTQMQALRNTVTINAGTDNGIRNGMPVVTDHGLVGRVVTTSGRYAIVQLLLHKDLRVSARVQRSRANGIIRWTGGHDLRLVNVPKTSDVNNGDVIVTSEFSSLFPGGIRVGVVSATREVPGELFQEITVQPSVDFGRMEEVFIVTVLPDSTRIVLERRSKE
jgi:rod shape-determining protein MreC